MKDVTGEIKWSMELSFQRTRSKLGDVKGEIKQLLKDVKGENKGSL